MDVTVLGSGSAHASAERGASGYWIDAGETHLLVDCGSGTLGRICRVGKSVADLSGIVITHHHPDHVSDLIPVLFEAKYASTNRTAPLPVFAPPTTRPVLDALLAHFGQWCVGETYDVPLREVESEAFQVGDCRVRPFPVQHGIPCIGLVIEHGGRRLAFTGDTGPFAELATEVTGAHLLVSDCTFASDEAGYGHLTARQAGELASEAGCERLLLSHLSPGQRDGTVIEDARRAFSGAVMAARDLTTIPV